MNRKDKARLARNLLLERNCDNCGKLYSLPRFIAFELFCSENENEPEKNICAEWDDKPKIDVCNSCVYYEDAWCYFRPNIKPTPNKNTCRNWNS